MPLSEHEQRMLDQIESALYAEDPKFASHVRGGRIRGASSRRRMQSIALFVLGLVLLVAGVALPLQPGGFPVISLVGFLVMFGAGVLLLWGGGKSGTQQNGESDAAPAPKNGGSGGRGPKKRANGGGGGFSSRMEERFRKRFEQ
ncbi:DUF3040 domain-containing protein [Rhodococcus rhodnii]|uniref:Transmembrane protein n=2 Tax=Rhodococcus rhodnii TaxID=38312 RepID=R7WS22_9NOCA|nr:DUF3040 domain-containing protein [Rhodococcus rhodnii]EOM78137.1 hypothetical protein Rrhod_0472 [Rhodococcus rhodnii LMG 5362]TXG91408.1 DUF3040 domain-containing protein [Rhodococcus rhodnii]